MATKKQAEPPAPAGPQLQVVAVDVKDVLGARQFRMEPGRVTLLEGRNGSGKSTALQAVQAALGRGSLAKIARVDEGGSEVEPEVVLVIEGPGQHLRVERSGDQVRVRRRVGDTAALEDVSRPQEFLAGLFDAECANPVRFLSAPDKERAILLLEALPLKFDRAQLLAEMGVTAQELLAMGSVPSGLHPLEEVSLIREAVFRTRTGVNRDEKQQRASAEQLRRNIPAVPPEDPGGEAQERFEAEVYDRAAAIAHATVAAEYAHRQAVTAADAALKLEEEKVRGSFKIDAARLRAEHDRKAAEIRAEAERRVAEDLAHAEAAIEALREGGEVILDEEEDRKAAAIKAADEILAAARAAIVDQEGQLSLARERLAVLKSQREGAARARALLDQVGQFDKQADRLKAESERLTQAIEALDAHRRRLGENLPIPGLSIEDRVIRVNGVPFEQLNTQAKVEIAVQVACLRAKGQRLPLVVVDGAEALDAEHFEALVAALKAQDVQAFVGRVADHDLSVRVA